ncbi:laminin G domain-containing protein [Actinoplanes sp. NPDC026619]|uniref:laminin G domain-containing protein n=1 Tax=Actinoplanes sp. NPDC026619 TaxID=3155798 RepID=UPI003401A6B3
MRNRHWIVTLTASIAAVTAGAAPAQATNWETVAVWSMDEPAGARVMEDSSGNGLHGGIGSEVFTGRSAGSSQGYGFGRLEPDTPPARPAHLVVVPDYAALDPGDRDYAVSLRLRTRNQFGNVIQKGQATVAGGSFKMQIPGGKVQCWFRGSAGQVLVTAPRPINDGDWHTVMCMRYRSGVSVLIDGVTAASKPGATGTISNAWPLSIGGKTTCDQIEVGCDYFGGDVDWVKIHAAGYDW